MRIIIFWDSISEGYCDYEFWGWANRLKAEYMKEYSYDRMLMNYGISAYTSDNFVNCFENFFQAVSRREPGKEKESIVIFAIGINDSSENRETWEKKVNIEKFEENIKMLIEKCQQEELIQNVIFLGNINVDESVINTVEDGEYSFFNNEIQKYNSVLKKLAEDTTCSYLELFWLMKPEDLEDGLHPNTQGHKKMYERVKEYLN
jgi:lysophospholipase L1-like esterase